MPAKYGQARNEVFLKAAAPHDGFPNKGKGNMSKTIEAVGRFDPISVLHAKAPLKGTTTGQKPSADILKSMLTALSEGRITDFVAGFQFPFKFTDHALDLEFNEPQQLTKFLEKSRELFPDTVIEVISVFQSGDAVIAEWELTATQAE
jgi:hypothetical protein